MLSEVACHRPSFRAEIFAACLEGAKLTSGPLKRNEGNAAEATQAWWRLPSSGNAFDQKHRPRPALPAAKQPPPCRMRGRRSDLFHSRNTRCRVP